MVILLEIMIDDGYMMANWWLPGAFSLHRPAPKGGSRTGSLTEQTEAFTSLSTDKNPALKHLFPF